MSIKEYNEDKRRENKQIVRNIEKNYIDNVLGSLDKVVEEKRAEIEEKLIKYAEECKVKEYTKDGKPYEIPNKNPILIQKYFFQSINPLVNVEPMYSAEKLGIVWQLYEEMVRQVSANIAVIVPSLSSFCAFAGIRLSTFKRYKQSLDEDMRVVVEKIEDGCFDSNVTLAQTGYIRERTTVYRMKSEQERIEKEMPSIHIHNDSVDLKDIKKRLSELQGFTNKKKLVEVEVVDEQ